MAFDLNKLIRASEFSFELSSVGIVRCKSLSDDLMREARKRLKAPNFESRELVRWLMGEMVRHPNIEKFQESDPIEGDSLTPEQLTAVTDQELELFSERLVQKNRYLVQAHEGGELKRVEGQSACDFLAYAIEHRAKEEKAQVDRIIRSATGPLFVESTLDSIQKSIAASNHFEDLIKQYVGASALDTFAEASRYLTVNSANVASAMHFKREQELRAAISPFQDAQHYLDQISTSAMLAKAIYHGEDLMRDAARGLALRESISAAIAAGLEKQQQQEIHNLRKSHEAMFRLPQAFEATRLLESYQVGAVAEFAQRDAKDILDRQRSLEAFTTPWLHRVEAARSVTAILELQGMGNALRTIKGFDPGLTAALRLDLGDWRDKITFPETVFIDPVARTDFYVTRGFNTALTDFPDAAFHQSLELAGLDGETLNFELYGPAVPRSSNPEEEAGLQRTNKCHDWIQRFERRLRQFIDDAMTAQYGPDWPRKRLAPALYEQWESKRQRAKSDGVILTFIDFADFTDYETIICKRDHWREIFETRFKKKESVRESLQRLQPIRLAAMHARIVTKEDELYLVAEVVRLISAIK